jgi:hypothetical protein
MLTLLKDLLIFLFARKKYWLMPIFLLMIFLGMFVVISQGSILAPFIYTIF